MNNAMELTSDNVEAITIDCLFKDDEEQKDYVDAEGIIHTYRFNRERLESHKDDIRSMLHQLPSQFFQHSGGGWTFLNACNREDGVQWTGFHLQMEKLFCLGIGVELARELMPKDMRKVLPGGMPYYVIFDDK